MKRVNKLRNLRIREISLVQAPASPGAHVILAKGLGLRIDPILKSYAPYESDAPPGDEADDAAARNYRSEQEQSDQLEDLCSYAIAHPPIPAETSADRWVRRIFGDDQAGALYGDQLAVLGTLFAALKTDVDLKKSASDAINALAAQIRANAPAPMPYEVAFTKACQTAEGQQLYAIMKHGAYAGADDEADDGADGADEDDPAAFLDNAAKEIQKADGVPQQVAYARACKQNPAVYAAMRKRGRG